ncbi:MAG: hypothetical protein WA708_18810 [Acidobacteriaceae bacterium]
MWVLRGSESVIFLRAAHSCKFSAAEPSRHDSDKLAFTNNKKAPKVCGECVYEHTTDGLLEFEQSQRR